MKAAPLQIDFAHPARRGAAPLARGMLLLGSLALMGVALIWADALQQRRALSQVQVRLERQQALRTAPAARAGPVEPQQLARERWVLNATRGLHTPWVDLLAALEAAPTQAVALLSVEPSAANRSVRLTAEGRDAKAMLAYLGALQRDTRLAQVVLIAHQVQLQSPGTPVRFQIQAQWATEP